MVDGSTITWTGGGDGTRREVDSGVTERGSTPQPTRRNANMESHKIRFTSWRPLNNDSFIHGNVPQNDNLSTIAYYNDIEINILIKCNGLIY